MVEGAKKNGAVSPKGDKKNLNWLQYLQNWKMRDFSPWLQGEINLLLPGKVKPDDKILSRLQSSKIQSILQKVAPEVRTGLRSNTPERMVQSLIDLDRVNSYNRKLKSQQSPTGTPKTGGKATTKSGGISVWDKLPTPSGASLSGSSSSKGKKLPPPPITGNNNNNAGTNKKNISNSSLAKPTLNSSLAKPSLNASLAKPTTSTSLAKPTSNASLHPKSNLNPSGLHPKSNLNPSGAVDPNIKSDDGKQPAGNNEAGKGTLDSSLHNINNNINNSLAGNLENENSLSGNPEDDNFVPPKASHPVTVVTETGAILQLSGNNIHANQSSQGQQTSNTQGNPTPTPTANNANSSNTSMGPIYNPSSLTQLTLEELNNIVTILTSEAAANAVQAYLQRSSPVSPTPNPSQHNSPPLSFGQQSTGNNINNNNINNSSPQENSGESLNPPLLSTEDELKKEVEDLKKKLQEKTRKRNRPEDDEEEESRRERKRRKQKERRQRKRDALRDKLSEDSANEDLKGTSSDSSNMSISPRNNSRIKKPTRKMILDARSSSNYSFLPKNIQPDSTAPTYVIEPLQKSESEESVRLWKAAIDGIARTNLFHTTWDKLTSEKPEEVKQGEENLFWNPKLEQSIMALTETLLKSLEKTGMRKQYEDRIVEKKLDISEPHKILKEVRSTANRLDVSSDHQAKMKFASYDWASSGKSLSNWFIEAKSRCSKLPSGFKNAQLQREMLRNALLRNLKEGGFTGDSEKAMRSISNIILIYEERFDEWNKSFEKRGFNEYGIPLAEEDEYSTDKVILRIQRIMDKSQVANQPEQQCKIFGAWTNPTANLSSTELEKVFFMNKPANSTSNTSTKQPANPQNKTKKQLKLQTRNLARRTHKKVKKAETKNKALYQSAYNKGAADVALNNNNNIPPPSPAPIPNPTNNTYYGSSGQQNNTRNSGQPNSVKKNIHYGRDWSQWGEKFCEVCHKYCLLYTSPSPRDS